MSKDLLEIARKSGILGQNDWDSLVKALSKNPGPKAQALAKRISTKYNLKVELLNDKKGNKTRDEATVIKLVNKGASSEQLHKALMMYRKPPEITGRRTKEANLLAYGKYSNDGRALLFPVSSKGYPVYSRGTTINVWEYISKTSEEEPAPLEILKEDEHLLEQRPTLLKRGVDLVSNWLKGDRT